MKSIQTRAPNAPVILVATHVDMVEKNKINEILLAGILIYLFNITVLIIIVVETKYTKKYPQIALIECVSTATMEGMKEFKKDLRRLAMEQPFIRARIPGKHYGNFQ